MGSTHNTQRLVLKLYLKKKLPKKLKLFTFNFIETTMELSV